MPRVTPAVGRIAPRSPVSEAWTKLMLVGATPTIPPLELTESDVARWREKLGPVATNGCRPWSKATDADGYGQMTIATSPGRRRTVKAHLVAWAVEVGPFPEGLEPDHVCVNRVCTTTAHLEWVTHEENVRRAFLREETCQSGRHRWDEQVPVRKPGGTRECRICRNESKRARYARDGKP